MAEQRFIRFKLPDETGKLVNVTLYASQFDDFAAGLLQVAASIPTPPGLTVDIPADINPAPISALDISPIAGSPDQARLAICVGPIALQLSVSVSDLLSALETLKSQTEPDPTSFHRPN